VILPKPRKKWWARLSSRRGEGGVGGGGGGGGGGGVWGGGGGGWGFGGVSSSASLGGKKKTELLAYSVHFEKGPLPVRRPNAPLLIQDQKGRGERRKRLLEVLPILLAAGIEMGVLDSVTLLTCWPVRGRVKKKEREAA